MDPRKLCGHFRGRSSGTASFVRSEGQETRLRWRRSAPMGRCEPGGASAGSDVVSSGAWEAVERRNTRRHGQNPSLIAWWRYRGNAENGPRNMSCSFPLGQSARWINITPRLCTNSKLFSLHDTLCALAEFFSAQGQSRRATTSSWQGSHVRFPWSWQSKSSNVVYGPSAQSDNRTQPWGGIAGVQMDGSREDLNSSGKGFCTITIWDLVAGNAPMP